MVVENSVPGNGEVSPGALVARTKYDLTAVIVQERGVYTMIEPNLGVDLGNRRTHAVPGKTALHYHPRRYCQTNHHISWRKYRLVPKRRDVMEIVAYSSRTTGGEAWSKREDEKLFV